MIKDIFIYILLPLTILLIITVIIIFSKIKYAGNRHRKKNSECMKDADFSKVIAERNGRISECLIMIPKDPEKAATILDKYVLFDDLIKKALIESKDIRLIRKVIEIHLNSASFFIDLLSNMGVSYEELVEIQCSLGVKGDDHALQWLNDNFSEKVEQFVLLQTNKFEELAKISESKGDFGIFNTIVDILHKCGNIRYDYKYVYFDKETFEEPDGTGLHRTDQTTWGYASPDLEYVWDFHYITRVIEAHWGKSYVSFKNSAMDLNRST